MKNLLILGPVATFVLTTVFFPIHDFASQFVTGLLALPAYGIVALVLSLTFPRFRKKRNGLWLALSVSALCAAVAFCIPTILRIVASQTG